MERNIKESGYCIHQQRDMFTDLCEIVCTCRRIDAISEDHCDQFLDCIIQNLP